MIDFIKKLFVGVLSFLSGLLKGKPQLNESNSEKPKPAATTKVEKPKPAVTSAKKPKSRGYFMELDEDNQPEIPNGTKTSPATIKVEPAKKTPVAAKVESKPEVEKPAKVELVQTAKGVKVEPAKAPVASTNSQTETTFAPKYLVPSATSVRRRPGPNMNPFLDMARQVNTPS